MLRPQKGNSRVSFNDTLLNFGLWNYREHLYYLLYFVCLLYFPPPIISKKWLKRDMFYNCPNFTVKCQ